MLYTDVDGNIRVDYNHITRNADGSAYLNSKDLQNYVMRSNSMNGDTINEFLKSKGSSYTYSWGTLNNNKIEMIDEKMYGTSFSNEEMKNIINDSEELMKNGYEMQAYIANTVNGKIRFLNPETKMEYLSTKIWGEGGAHAVKITGMTQDVFIVSSWGERLLIPYSDLQQSGAFTIFMGNYEKK